MSIYEYNEELHNKTLREEGREELLKELVSEGIITQEDADSHRQKPEPVTA